MAERASTATTDEHDPHLGRRGRGRFGIWPWVAAFFLVLALLTAIDVAFYRDDIQRGDQQGEVDQADQADTGS